MPDAEKKVPNTIGKRIAQARRELGCRLQKDIAPSHLADMVGVSETTVYRWEGDEKKPSDANLEKLAQKLGVTRPWLKFGEGDKHYADTIPEVQPMRPTPKKNGRKTG